MYDIAVIVCIFDSPFEKAVATLASIACQVDVFFEVVIADDGSSRDDTARLQQFLLSNGLLERQVKIVRSNANRGTVGNILNALQYVEAPYVKPIAPGDFLYDSQTLNKYVETLNNSQADFVFGRGVHYSVGNSLIIHDICCPVFPARYNTKQNGNERAIESLAIEHDYVLGAALAYRKEAWIPVLCLLKGHVRYVEDNTSITAMLLAGGSAAVIDEYVVWYERGTGVSTTKNELWRKRINADFDAFWSLMAERYPDNKNLQNAVVCSRANSYPRFKKARVKIIWRMKHPETIPSYITKKLTQKRFKCGGYDLEHLYEYLAIAHVPKKIIARGEEAKCK